MRVAIDDDNQEYIPIGMNVSVFAGNESRHAPCAWSRIKGAMRTLGRDKKALAQLMNR